MLVITGALSGVGRATALAFARQAGCLALAARDKAALTEIAGEWYVSRRQSIAGISVAALAGLLVPSAYAQQKRETTGVGIGPKGGAIEDEDIFTFTLNLEYMEAEFYLRATTSKGISDADAGTDAGRVVGGHEAQFKEKAVREFIEEIAENELADVRFYRKTVGRSAISRPAIDFDAGFKAAAQAAGRSCSAACCPRTLA